jgi:hypothetical protein
MIKKLYQQGWSDGYRSGKIECKSENKKLRTEIEEFRTLIISNICNDKCDFWRPSACKNCEIGKKIDLEVA